MNHCTSVATLEAERSALIDDARRLAAAGQVRAALRTFPGIRSRRPLALGIAGELYSLLGDDLAKAIQRELGRHCNRYSYYAALAAADSMRVSLWGDLAGEVSAEARKLASARLVELQARAAAREEAAAAKKAPTKRWGVLRLRRSA